MNDFISKCPKKMGWERILLLLSSILLFSMLAQGETITRNGIEYSYSESEGKAYPMRYTGSSELVIPNSILIKNKEYSIDWKDGLWIINAPSLQKVKIDISSRYIENFCFRDCSGLVKAEIACGVIGEFMFYDCPNLDIESIMASGVIEVGAGAFSLSSPREYESITLDGFNYYILNYALGNRLYKNIIIDGESIYGALDETEWYDSEGATSIVFEGMDLSKTQHLTFKNLVLGNQGFPLDAIEEVEIRHCRIRELHPRANNLTIQNCSVEKFYLGTNYAGIISLADCRVKEFELRGNNIQTLSLDGEFDSVKIHETDVLASLTIPKDRVVNTLWMKNCKNFHSLSVEGICQGMSLYELSSLKELEDCAGVKEASVSDCVQLTSISLPGIEKLRSLSYNPMLKEVYIGSTLKSMCGQGLFYASNALTDIIYGGSIEDWLRIDRYTEYHSYEEIVQGEGNLPVENFWYGHGKAKMTKLTELNSSYLMNVDTIPVGAFAGYLGLVSIDLPSSVTHICASAFASCENLKDITMNPEKIEQFAFYGDDKITDITIGSAVKYIGPAFTGNMNLATLNYLGTPNQWLRVVRSSLAYRDPHDSTSETYSRWGCISLPVPTNMLFNGAALQDIVLEEPEEIPSGIFLANKTLRSVKIVLGAKTPSIGSAAFRNCPNLISITYEGQIPSDDLSQGFEIGTNAFSGCEKLKDIEVLDCIKSIGYDALENTAWLKSQPQQEILYFETEKGLTAYCYVGEAPENTVLNIKDGTKVINSRAFGDYDYYARPEYNGIIGVKFPDTLIEIGSWAFHGRNLTGNFIIPASVNFIEGEDLTTSHFNTLIIEDSELPLDYAYIEANAENVYIGREYNDGLINGGSDLHSITYGPQIKEVKENMGIGYVESVHVKAQTPPEVAFKVYYGYDYTVGLYEYEIYPAFSQLDYETCILYVPKGTLDDYKESRGWKEFKNIVEESGETGIESVVLDNPDASLSARHYDINGNLIPENQKGIHIIIYSDGSSKKIIK